MLIHAVMVVLRSLDLGTWDLERGDPLYYIEGTILGSLTQQYSYTGSDLDRLSCIAYLFLSHNSLVDIRKYGFLQITRFASSVKERCNLCKQANLICSKIHSEYNQEQPSIKAHD